jgi:hypothetical protein
MFYQQDIFIGVDVSSAKLPYNVAVLNGTGDLLALEKCSLEEVVKYTAGYGSVVIAVNAPRFLPAVRMDAHAFRDNLIPLPANGSYAGQRVAEYLLKTRIIRFSAIPAPPNQIPVWIRNGLRLYQHFDLMVKGRSVIEVNAQACYQSFLGIPPFKKSSIEGRIQRQLVLIDHGIKLTDPMEYFEEVTRHRLLHGILPDAMLYSARQLDALVAALMARMSYQVPAATVSIGDDSDGWIVLPVGKTGINK